MINDKVLIQKVFNEKLEEDFIRKNFDKLNWDHISKFQKLSEDFIVEFMDYVNIEDISTYQKLSARFIEKYKEKLNMSKICCFQILSEDFIEEYKHLCIFRYILLYQRLSAKFLKKYSVDIINDSISITSKATYPFNFLDYKNDELFNRILALSWMYKDKEYKRNKIASTKLYNIDNDYVYAYKAVRNSNYSVLNFQYLYEIGKTYTAHADYNPENENSFGLSAWTYEGAKDYYSSGKILRVKAHLDDIACLVLNGNKLRCRKIEIVDKIY